MTLGGSVGPPVGDGSEDYAHDYEALRQGVGAVDLGRDVVRLWGRDAVEYLQGQCSQDVAALQVGEWADALILTPQGKLEVLVRVVRTGDDEMVVDVDEGFGDHLMTRLIRFKLRVQVAIERLDWRSVSLRGPAAPAADAFSEAPPGASLVVGFAWNGVRGIDLVGEGPQIPPGVPSCSRPAWESVRIESGIPVMGAELDERTIAAEAELLERCVSFTKGCYTGQELIARLDARGNRVARQLRGLVVTDLFDAVSGVPSGSEAVAGGKVVGSVTSSAWSPALGRPVALAYLHRAVAPGDTVELRLPAEGQGEAGAASVPAEVRTLPLVS